MLGSWETHTHGKWLESLWHGLSFFCTRRPKHSKDPQLPLGTYHFTLITDFLTTSQQQLRYVLYLMQLSFFLLLLFPRLYLISDLKIDRFNKVFITFDILYLVTVHRTSLLLSGFICGYLQKYALYFRNSQHFRLWSLLCNARYG